MLVREEAEPCFPKLVLGLQGKVVVAERSHTGAVLEELQPLGGSMWWGRDQMLRTDHNLPSPCPLTGKGEVRRVRSQVGPRKKGTLSFVLVSHYPTLF